MDLIPVEVDSTCIGHQVFKGGAPNKSIDIVCILTIAESVGEKDMIVHICLGQFPWDFREA
jgi:hypothetical protein